MESKKRERPNFEEDYPRPSTKKRRLNAPGSSQGNGRSPNLQHDKYQTYKCDDPLDKIASLSLGDPAPEEVKAESPKDHGQTPIEEE